MRRGAAVAVVAAGAVALAGCGGGSNSSAGGRLPACVHPNATVDGDLGFPLPSGSVLERHHRELGRDVVDGFVPGTLEGVRDYFRRVLPEHGYTLGEGDAEEHEAETDYSGHGVKGHLKLHDIAGCDGAVTVSLAFGD